MPQVEYTGSSQKNAGWVIFIPCLGDPSCTSIVPLSYLRASAQASIWEDSATGKSPELAVTHVTCVLTPVGEASRMTT